MAILMAWCTFLGAWLLVAGPLYQAVLELEQEDVAFARWRTVAREVAPPPLSMWWWLIPPVYLILRLRRRRAHQAEIKAHLSDPDFEAASAFWSKAVGWFTVGLGAFLIAMSETWELSEKCEWPHLLVWILGPILLAASMSNALWQARRRSRSRREHSGAER